MMALVAICSAKGSPGVTASALALTLTWPQGVLLAELDPSGGSILPGYLQGQVDSGRGILASAVASLGGHDLLHHAWGQLIDLETPHELRLVLLGITDPVQSATLAPRWAQFAQLFTDIEHTTKTAYDVIADCGRLTAPNTPWPVIHTADLVLLTVRPTLPGISAAYPAVEAITKQLTDNTAGDGGHKVGLLVVGNGTYTAKQAASQLGIPLVAHLPGDTRTADVLSFGGQVSPSRPLMRAARDTEVPIRRMIAARRDRVLSRPMLTVGEAS